VHDHTPGFPSAAKFVAAAMMGDNFDNRSLPGIKVDIIMGRHAGYLTAASVLARQHDEDGPHLIYVPEATVSEEEFIADVDRIYSKRKRCLIAVSEGITGHDRKGQLPPDIDWASIADPSATTIVYMPKKTLSELAARAIAQGLDPGTPAVAIANATRGNEAVIAAPISQIAGKLAIAGLDGPVLVMIGRTMAAAARERDPVTGTHHAAG